MTTRQDGGRRSGSGTDVRVLALAAAGSLALAGCATVAPVGDVDNPLDVTARQPALVHWPRAYEPDSAAFFVHNHIDIDAAPEDVWPILVDAEAWPAFYEGASNVVVEGDGGDGRLAPGSTFRWTTMDLDFVSSVKEFEPPTRLAWESRKSTIVGYHTWLVVPLGRGCRLVTAESQYGFLTVLQKVFVPTKLHDLHDVWLGQIKKRAEAAARARG